MFSAMSLVFSCSLLGQASAAQPRPESDEPKIQAQRWNEYYQREAAGYKLYLDRDEEKSLKFHPESVLRWHNQVRGGETNGAVFVWTWQGRAEAVGTIFSYIPQASPNQRNVAHSFHTLSLRPLTAQRAGAAFWSPRETGLDPKPIPGADPPAKTAALRLAQMRTLAGQFRASTTHEVERDLRLLTQPLFRNERASDEVLDGALFTFVTGTDPEIMLVIEARRTADGHRWHYAAARFSDLGLKVWHKEALVWTDERIGTPRSPDQRYISLHGVAVMPKLLEE